MAKFFLSHSSEDAGLVGLFVNLLEDGIGISRSDIRCSSLPGYGLPLGSPFRDVIRDDIAASDIVIALVSQDFVESAYCMGEIGISWGLKKRIIPLLLPQTTISDIGGLLGLFIPVVGAA